MALSKELYNQYLTYLHNISGCNSIYFYINTYDYNLSQTFEELFEFIIFFPFTFRRDTTYINVGFF